MSLFLQFSQQQLFLALSIISEKIDARIRLLVSKSKIFISAGSLSPRLFTPMLRIDAAAPVSVGFAGLDLLDIM
jgi:hypothetical protein